MPQVIKDLEDYLYETRRDVFFLELIRPRQESESDPESSMGWSESFRTPEVKANMKIATDWFDRNGIKWALTAPPGLIVGWIGHLYVDFSGWDDPKHKAWCDEFEIDDLTPRFPDKFAMFALSYKDWVDSSKLAKYEKFLKSKMDPDWSL